MRYDVFLQAGFKLSVRKLHVEDSISCEVLGRFWPGEPVELSLVGECQKRSRVPGARVGTAD